MTFLGTVCAWCQQPPPPPGGPPAPPQRGAVSNYAQQPFSSNGTIRSWNYGPSGDVNGFILDRNVLVMLPPDFGATLLSMGRIGSRVGISGYGRSGVNVPTVVDAQMLTVNGQTLNIGAMPGGSQPPSAGVPPPPQAGRRGPPPPPRPGAPPPTAQD
jgi:hypothetical protein